MRAIEHANRVIDWQENLMKEDMPPRWMWHLDHELAIWFEEVEERHKNRYSSSPSADDSTSSSMMKNEWSR